MNRVNSTRHAFKVAIGNELNRLYDKEQTIAITVGNIMDLFDQYGGLLEGQQKLTYQEWCKKYGLPEKY